ncbi:MAG TPA: hypothetical protein VGH16_17220 [Candidatus Binatia bacterium]
MKAGALFRESVEIHIAEGHGFAAYFYLLVLLAPVVFLALFLPALDAQIWIAPAAFFSISSVAAMILTTYFALRLANQEFAPWRFVPLRRRLGEEKLSPAEVAKGHGALLCLEVAVLIMLAAPLLAWAGAIARIPIRVVLTVLALLFFYGLAYGVWGLTALAAWERKLEVRQVFIRAFFISVMILTTVFYVPMNPVGYLLGYLGDKDMAPLLLWGRRWSAGTAHFTFHFLLLGAGAWIYYRALKREIGS